MQKGIHRPGIPVNSLMYVRPVQFQQGMVFRAHEQSQAIVILPGSELLSKARHGQVGHAGCARQCHADEHLR